MKKIEIEISDNAVFFPTKEDFDLWEKKNFVQRFESLTTYPTKFPCYGEHLHTSEQVGYNSIDEYHYAWYYPLIEN